MTLKNAAQAVDHAATEFVEKTFFPDERTLPVVYRASIVGIDVADWYDHNRERIDSDLLEYGAILFRGFAFAGEDHFEKFAKASLSELAARRDAEEGAEERGLNPILFG